MQSNFIFKVNFRFFFIIKRCYILNIFIENIRIGN